MHSFYENRRKIEKGNLSVAVYENEDFSYLAHWHQEIEIVWVEEGVINVGINHQTHEMHTGDMCLFKSGDIHYYASQEASSKVVILVCRVDLVEGLYEWLGEHEEVNRFMSKEDIKMYGLSCCYELFQKICQEDLNKFIGYQQLIKAYASELCIEIIRKWPFQMAKEKKVLRGDSQLELLQKILVYIEKNITEELEMTSVAKTFNIDAFYLSKLFNAITGMHFKTYINTIRVVLAEEKLISSQKSIIEIAYESGFNSVRTFNRAFKSIKGKTPKEMRQT